LPAEGRGVFAGSIRDLAGRSLALDEKGQWVVGGENQAEVFSMGIAFEELLAHTRIDEMVESRHSGLIVDAQGDLVDHCYPSIAIILLGQDLCLPPVHDGRMRLLGV